MKEQRRTHLKDVLNLLDRFYLVKTTDKEEKIILSKIKEQLVPALEVSIANRRKAWEKNTLFCEACKGTGEEMGIGRVLCACIICKGKKRVTPESLGFTKIKDSIPGGMQDL